MSNDPLSEWAEGQRCFKDWVQACSTASVGHPSPPIFLRWAALTCVSAALGRHVMFNTSKRGLGGITIRPNIYSVLVARPGRFKSLSISLPFGDILEPLSQVIGTGGREAELNSLSWKKYLPYSTHPIYTVSDSATYQEMARQMDKLSHPLLEFPPGMFESAVTLITDEWGTFMDRDSKGLQTFLTQCWDSKNRVEYHTKNKGTDFILGGTITWMAGSTPEQFIANLPKNADEQGLLSRLLPVYYEGARKPAQREIEGCDADTAEWLRMDLGRIASIYGQYRFSDEANVLFDEWIAAGEPPLPSDPSMEEFNTRRWAHRIKIAMCVAASRHSGLVIEADDWNTAHAMVTEIEHKMPRLLRRFSMGDAGKFADQLLEFMEDNAPTIRGVRQMRSSRLKQEALRLCKTSQDVDRTLQLMIDAGYIEDRDGMFVLREEME